VIDPQTTALVIVSVMAMACVLAFVHAKESLLAEREEVRSRARVVREMRQIRLHRQHHVVDVDGLDRSFWKDEL
jgi:hypothetical protein